MSRKLGFAPDAPLRKVLTRKFTSKDQRRASGMGANNWVRIELECGHVVETVASNMNNNATRHRCYKCAQG